MCKDGKQGEQNSISDTRGVLSLDSLKELLLPIAKQYEIKSISVFGSYARNEAKPTSDVDLLIDGGNFIGLVEYMDMVKHMENALGRTVDVVMKSSFENSDSIADRLFHDVIEKEKVKLI